MGLPCASSSLDRTAVASGSIWVGGTSDFCVQMFWPLPGKASCFINLSIASCRSWSAASEKKPFVWTFLHCLGIFVCRSLEVFSGSLKTSFCLDHTQSKPFYSAWILLRCPFWLLFGISLGLRLMSFRSWLWTTGKNLSRNFPGLLGSTATSRLRTIDSCGGGSWFFIMCLNLLNMFLSARKLDKFAWSGSIFALFV